MVFLTTFIVQMGVDGKTIDVTGRFDDVTGQYNPSLTLYHKGEKWGAAFVGCMIDSGQQHIIYIRTVDLLPYSN